MIDHLLSPILSLHAPLAYVLVGILAFGEAAVLLGFVLPGETAVILGGVLASRGNVDIGVMVLVACFAAVAGDSVGYEFGRSFGSRILATRLLQRRRRALDAARAFLVRRGWWAVFVGRFTAFLRAVVPGLAGMSEMPYPRFLAANAAGGVLWATGYTMLGYLLGHAYKQVEKISGWASEGLVVAVVLVLVALWLRRRRRESLLETTAASGDEDAGGRPADEGRRGADDPAGILPAGEDG